MKKLFTLITVALFAGLFLHVSPKVSAENTTTEESVEVKYARVTEYTDKDDYVYPFNNVLNDGKVLTYTIRLQLPDKAVDAKIKMPESYAYQTYVASENLSKEGNYTLRFTMNEEEHILGFSIYTTGLTLDGLYSGADYYVPMTLNFEKGEVSILDNKADEKKYINVESGYRIDKTGKYSVRIKDDYGNFTYYTNMNFHLDNEGFYKDKNKFLFPLAVTGLAGVVAIAVFQIVVVVKKKK